MSEPGQVRLVRCPKCDNLLPEVPDYSVYLCGGCGAVLRAKNRTVEVETLSQKSDEERVRGVSERFPHNSGNFYSSEKEMNFSDGSENDLKSNSSSHGRANRSEALSHIADSQASGSSGRTDKWVADNDPENIERLTESAHVEMGKGFEELEPPNAIANGSRRLGCVADWRNGERAELEGVRRNLDSDVEGIRYLTSNYSEDGPSDYHMRSSYGYGEPLKSQNKPEKFDKVEYTEQDRAELLRKLDELKDQLSRSCEVNEKPKERVPFDQRVVHQDEPYGGSENWLPNGLWGSNRPSAQYPMPESYLARVPYVGHYPEPPPYISGHELDMNGFYPSMHPATQIQRFGDPMRSQMPRRAPHQPRGALPQQPSHPYFSGQYMDNGMVPFEPYHPNMNPHHPSCSCFHCYNKHAHVPAPVPTAAFCNKMFPDVANNPVFYHHENKSAFAPRDYNPKIANPPKLNPHNSQSQTRWPSDLNSEVGGFVRRRPPRVVLATGARRCHPIAGGAPFVACYNCFELLQLPKKILVMDKTEKKVLCGSCSTVIVLVVVNKRLVVSVDAEARRTSKMVDDDSSNVKLNGSTSHAHVHANQASMNFSSEDFDNAGYDFHSMDREVMSASTGQGFCLGKSAEMRSPRLTSPYSSEDEDNSNSLNVREEFNSAELAVKANPSPPPAGSPLQDYFDYSNKYHAMNRLAKGNQSGRSERENGELKKAASRQNSMKDASLATETDVSFNEYSNTGTSQESRDASREDQPRANKGGQSFFAGFIKKSFRDLSRSNNSIEQGLANVTINGHPIPDRVLKKAEKLAGPIHPGHYWYDFRAGFWGVMGGPCLGIIPPFIEEFNFPLLEDCAGGNTGVFVNGRELHQKDLNLLGNRGLPTTSDKSYIVEISGRVLDEDTGEELDSLGKLAPTVEKVKHGFGMKAPKVAI